MAGARNDLLIYAALKRHSTGSSMLLKSWQRRDYIASVEVEGYCAVQISAVDVDPRGLQAGEDVGFGKTERGSEAERDHSEAWLYGGQDFWSSGGGAAVMSYL